MNAKHFCKLLQICTFYLILGASSSLVAQDKILTKSDMTIKCTITKVGSEYVEYLNENEEYGKILKSKVHEIEFNKMTTTPIDFSSNTKNAIKINLLSPRYNALQISYETALDARSSIEFTAKIYGISVLDFPESKTGGGLEIGYRFRMGDFFDAAKKGKFNHVLDGIGIKPVIGSSYAKTEAENAIEKYYYFYFGTLLNYQAVFNNRIILETYAGVNIYKGSSMIEFDNTPPLTGILDFEDGDLKGSQNLAYSLGIKIGITFGSFDRESPLLRW